MYSHTSSLQFAYVEIMIISTFSLMLTNYSSQQRFSSYNFPLITSTVKCINSHLGCDEAQWTARFTTPGKKQGTMHVSMYACSL